ncbi:MAG: BamA/TamA family outer membrane protein [Saprospiraceae bacterium]|nr:BamA/TamA family outer membrane protein [Saprospiraceae bacterium]
MPERFPEFIASWIGALLCLLPVYLSGQTDASLPKTSAVFVVVDHIQVEGNHKTREKLIFRELEFGLCDTLPVADLGEILERNRLRIMNLGIFSKATITVDKWDEFDQISLKISLIESWYIFPVPLIEFADRNFNVWWTEQNRSLKRINFGIDATHLNLSGNADNLKVKAQFGYANKYEMSYRKPNINRAQTLGIQSSVQYIRQHEVAVSTIDNKLDFRRNRDIWQYNTFTAFTTLGWRPRLLSTHNFTLEYRRNEVSDSVGRIYNPDFFLKGRTVQRHFSLVVNYARDFRDVRPYPWRGYYFNTELRVNGLLPSDDLHLSRFFAEYSNYKPLHKNISLESGVKGRISLPRSKPPYFNNQGLGYGGVFVRGYEYYVIDGLDFFLLRTSLHFKFLERTFHFPRWIPVSFRELPIKLFLSANNDYGYVVDPHYAALNPLANRSLYGNGIGLDVIAYYTQTARFEYTRNHLGEWGFYARISTGF